MVEKPIGEVKEASPVGQGGVSQLLPSQKRCECQTLSSPQLCWPLINTHSLSSGQHYSPPVGPPYCCEMKCLKLPSCHVTDACLSKSWGREGTGQMGSSSAPLHPDSQALLLLWVLGTTKKIKPVFNEAAWPSIMHSQCTVTRENPAAKIQARIPESEQGENEEDSAERARAQNS